MLSRRGAGGEHFLYYSHGMHLQRDIITEYYFGHSLTVTYIHIKVLWVGMCAIMMLLGITKITKTIAVSVEDPNLCLVAGCSITK